ncbi:hypothetical protein [Flavobacterium ovatum]|uniref:hypothetical protein n=1 Tax=Flavobacterium ovatum TaxID=1928857 RepID=UPI00344C7100
MKRIFTIAAALMMTANIWAQAPEKMSYQAVIRNASNELVNTQNVGMQISILQTSATGTAIYVETQTPSTNANGLISLEIGTGTLVSGDFTTIDWANGTYFIKTETDPIGGTSYTITGTTQLMSVPYALHAKTAENFTGNITESQISDLKHEKISNIQLNGSILEITEGGQAFSIDLSPITSQAYSEGYNLGYDTGYDNGYDTGFDDGYNIGGP